MGVDVNLFKQLCEDSDRPKGTAELASACGVEPVLMG